MDSRSPYRAPGAKLADPAPRPGSPYKAVALGLLTDFGGTLALSLIVAPVSPESWPFYAISIGGGAFSVLGGYVCARIAGQSEYTLGAILAAINVVLGLALGGDDADVGMQIVLNVATVACVILGARLGKARNRRGRV